MWKIKLSNWFTIDTFSSPKQTLNKVKGIFKPAKMEYHFNWGNYCPYFLYCSKPAFITIRSVDVGWKDKYDTPRFEEAPYIWIHIYKLNFVWIWRLDEQAWEQILWYLYYNKTYSQGLQNIPDIDSAKESWPWIEYESEESTWNDNYLKEPIKILK